MGPSALNGDCVHVPGESDSRKPTCSRDRKATSAGYCRNAPATTNRATESSDAQQSVSNLGMEPESNYNVEAIDDSDTESEVEFEEKAVRQLGSFIEMAPCKNEPRPRVPSQDTTLGANELDEEDIAISDLEMSDDEANADLIPYNRLTIYNAAALNSSFARVAIKTDDSVVFSHHQCITSTGNPTSESVPDVYDDLHRELALYAQCLEAANLARIRLRAEGVPFTRPSDYFAEMIKEDAHMDKVHHRMVEEASAKKASVEARKLRDLKKFGKQVQVAKLQERHKAKRETLEKIKELKRKRQTTADVSDSREADMFDVGIDNELGGSRNKGNVASSRGGGGAPSSKRQRKDDKYGFGGKKRFMKSGDAISSGDMSTFNGRRSGPRKNSRISGTKGVSKGGRTVRLGKSRRPTSNPRPY
jgi:rRNA-processing protein EBP2